MKIEPYYEDNEPLCTHDCPACFDDFPNWWKCRIKQSEVDEGEPCIPALRRDRDQAIKERDEVRREICEVASESALNEGLAISPKMMARQREWDCYDTPPKETDK